MCAYAAEVFSGVFSGPYNDNHARHFARACLIPAELADRHNLDVERAAPLATSPPTSCALHASPGPAKGCNTAPGGRPEDRRCGPHARAGVAR